MRNKNHSSSFSEKSKDPPMHPPTHSHIHTNLAVTQSQHTPSTQSQHTPSTQSQQTLSSQSQHTIAFHPHQTPIAPLLKSSKKGPVFEAQR
jgi:hypothetical protein